MRFLAAAALALTGVACTYRTPPPEPTPAPHAAACDAAPARHLVGRPASPELAAEAQRRTGARVWRWLRPGQIVTMEYRADRLNIRLDAQDKVEGLSCG
jgi:hypothetical protein